MLSQTTNGKTAIKGGGIMESQILIAIVGLAAIITPISTIAMLKVHNANK